MPSNSNEFHQENNQVIPPGFIVVESSSNGLEEESPDEQQQGCHPIIYLFALYILISGFFPDKSVLGSFLGVNLVIADPELSIGWQGGQAGISQRSEVNKNDERYNCDSSSMFTICDDRVEWQPLESFSVARSEYLWYLKNEHSNVWSVSISESNDFSGDCNGNIDSEKNEIRLCGGYLSERFRVSGLNKVRLGLTIHPFQDGFEGINSLLYDISQHGDYNSISGNSIINFWDINDGVLTRLFDVFYLEASERGADNASTTTGEFVSKSLSSGGKGSIKIGTSDDVSIPILALLCEMKGNVSGLVFGESLNKAFKFPTATGRPKILTKNEENGEVSSISFMLEFGVFNFGDFSSNCQFYNWRTESKIQIDSVVVMPE